MVVATYVDNFEDVLPKRPVLRLLDPSSIEMVVSIPDSLIGYAPYVEGVSVRFDTLPDTEIKVEIKREYSAERLPQVWDESARAIWSLPSKGTRLSRNFPFYAGLRERRPAHLLLHR